MVLSFDLKSLVASQCLDLSVRNLQMIQLSAQNMWNLREEYFQISNYTPV